MRLKALEAHGRRARTSVDKADDTSKLAGCMAELQVLGRLRSGGVPGEKAAVVGQKCAPYEEVVDVVMSLADTVFRRPVRFQVGSRVNIDGTLGLVDEVRCTYPESFEMLGRTQTEFAHPTAVVGTDRWIDELRILTSRRFDR